MKKFLKKEGGSIFVEATFVFPLIIIVILIFLYMTVIMLNRAYINSVLNRVVSNEKINITTDSYYYNENGDIVEIDRPDVYRDLPLLHNKEYEENIKKTFKQECRIEGCGIDVKVNSYGVYKKITAIATKSYDIPLLNILIDGESRYKTVCVCKAVCTDSDQMILKTDYIKNLLLRTEMGSKANEFINETVDKILNFIDKES